MRTLELSRRAQRRYGQVLDESRAISRFARMTYSAAARAIRAGGQVKVQVTIDEDGNVIAANAISGHPLLMQASTSAAKSSKFSPTTLTGRKVKVTGVIIYNFTQS